MSDMLYSKLKGQHRMYYKDDWHCDCDNHTIDSDLIALQNTFGKYCKVSHEIDKDNRISYHVSEADDCVITESIRGLEFHGLMLDSIHSEHRGWRTSLGFIFRRKQYWIEKPDYIVERT